MIYAASGQLLLTKNVANSQQFEISLEQYPVGIYFFSFENEQKIYFSKIIKN